MLVCSVVLQPKRRAIGAAVVEHVDAVDAYSLGAILATLTDDPGAASDTVSAFVGQLMVEAASATATVNANSIRNAAIVEENIALATVAIPGTYALAVVETATADALHDGAIGVVAPGINASVIEPATAEDWPYSATILTAAAGAVLEGAFVDPQAPSTILGSEIPDSGPISIFFPDKSGLGQNPGTPTTGIPLAPDGPTPPDTEDGFPSGGPGTWTVPAGWNNASNSIEVFGGGAGGCCYRPGNIGGGGGGYSKIVNLTLVPGTIISFHIGAGGLEQGGNGGDTWFRDTATVYAQGGRGQTGGQASAGIGTVKYSGGNGGSGSTYGAGGGGGAAGPNGDGGTGGVGAGGANGAGGGGNGGGATGYAAGASGTLGGKGGNNSLGKGGGEGATYWPNTSGAPGTVGGGGGGSATYHAGGDLYYAGDGGMGGHGNEYGKFIGSGGGGGGGGAFCVGGRGGFYGGGGGGASPYLWPAGIGGKGAAGVVIIRYDPI